MSDAESAKTQTHSAKTALFHRFSPNGSALWRPHPLKARTGRQHAGELRHPRLRHAGDTPSEGFAWRKTPFAAGVEGAGGTGRHGRDWWAWLRRPRAVVGPGRALNQRVQPHISDPAPLVWRAPEGPEGTGGLRDRSLRAKLACGDLAGGRARRRPEHPWGYKRHHAARTARGRAAAHGHTKQPGRGATSNTINWAKQPGSTQQRARSAAAPRAPRVCQWLTG